MGFYFILLASGFSGVISEIINYKDQILDIDPTLKSNFSCNSGY